MVEKKNVVYVDLLKMSWNKTKMIVSGEEKEKEKEKVMCKGSIVILI